MHAEFFSRVLEWRALRVSRVTMKVRYFPCTDRWATCRLPDKKQSHSAARRFASTGTFWWTFDCFSSTWEHLYLGFRSNRGVFESILVMMPCLSVNEWIMYFEGLVCLQQMFLVCGLRSAVCGLLFLFSLFYWIFISGFCVWQCEFETWDSSFRYSVLDLKLFVTFSSRVWFLVHAVVFGMVLKWSGHFDAFHCHAVNNVQGAYRVFELSTPVCFIWVNNTPNLWCCAVSTRRMLIALVIWGRYDSGWGY